MSSSLVVNHSAPTQRSGALGIYNASGDVGKLVFTGTFSFGITIGAAWYEISMLYGLLALIAAFAVGLMTRSLSSGFRQKNSNSVGSQKKGCSSSMKRGT